jgi:hypothetical protein
LIGSRADMRRTPAISLTIDDPQQREFVRHRLVLIQ